MTTSTLTPSFRQVVADVAQRAKAILPATINGRVESAVALVLAHDVLFLDNGTVEVGSASDPLKVHVLSGSTCDCADFPRAPESWCKHRLAAGIMKRVREELARQPEPEPEVELPADFEPWGDNDHEGEEVERTDLGHLPMLPQPAPAPAPLPEARSSVNVHVTIAGRDCQLTLRDHDEHSLLARLEAVLARYPMQAKPQASPPAATTPPEEQRFCPKHGDKMQLNHKEGRTWHSHKTAEGWCKGK